MWYQLITKRRNVGTNLIYIWDSYIQHERHLFNKPMYEKWHHFADARNVYTLVHVSLNFVRKSQYNTDAALVYVTALQLIDVKPSTEHMMSKFSEVYMHHQGAGSI